MELLKMSGYTGNTDKKSVVDFLRKQFEIHTDAADKAKSHLLKNNHKITALAFSQAANYIERDEHMKKRG